MSIKVGRAHGNGYHDSVVRKITAKRSKGYYDLIEYEMEQLEQHGNIIYERDYNSDSIVRICLRCPTRYNSGHIEYMEKQGDVFVCPHCRLVKVPKGVKFDASYECDDEEEEDEYIMCPECSMYFAKLCEDSGTYYCEYCNHEFPHVEMAGLI